MTFIVSDSDSRKDENNEMISRTLPIVPFLCPYMKVSKKADEFIPYFNFSCYNQAICHSKTTYHFVIECEGQMSKLF
jgi:hypothetical protein